MNSVDQAEQARHTFLFVLHHHHFKHQKTALFHVQNHASNKDSRTFISTMTAVILVSN